MNCTTCKYYKKQAPTETGRHEACTRYPPNSRGYFTRLWIIDIDFNCGEYTKKRSTAKK